MNEDANRFCLACSKWCSPETVYKPVGIFDCICKTCAPKILGLDGHLEDLKHIDEQFESLCNEESNIIESIVLQVRDYDKRRKKRVRKN